MTIVVKITGLLTFVFASYVEIQETNSHVFMSTIMLSTSDLVSSTKVDLKVTSGGEEGY